jgi:hypothetical protein
VIIYSKVLELGVYQISCSFSQDLEVVLIIISNSITYCALKTYIQILKVVAAHWTIPSNIAPVVYKIGVLGRVERVEQ